MSIAPPKPTELEVSIFGPGYGEAIAVHVGDGAWVLIDSCIDEQRRAVSLEYLRQLGVDVAHAVKLVVITHWHDDHIKGMLETVEACTSAKVAVSQSLRNGDFLTLAELSKVSAVPGGSGVDDFRSILEIVKSRKPKGAKQGVPTWSHADRLVFSQSVVVQGNAIDVRIHTLSPSDATMTLAFQSFAGLVPSAGSGSRRISPPKENHASVVVLVEAGADRVLLGADLETSPDPLRGWGAIINHAAAKVPTSQVFKVPHHGSDTAHENAIWTSLLDADPVAVVTGFSRGKKPLPSPEDLKRIAGSTQKAYATSLPKAKKLKPSESTVREFLKSSTTSLEAIPEGQGHVQLRKPMGASAEWDVTLFGTASKLSP